MQRGIQTEIQRVLLLSTGLLVFGYFNGHLLLTLLAGGIAYMAWTARKIQNLYHWLNAGARGLPPDASGIWGDISDQLFRLKKRSLRSQHSLKLLTERVQKITNALADGILVLNSSRSLEWWNPAAEILLSLQSGDRNQAIMNLVRDPLFVEFIQQQTFPEPLEIAVSDNRTLLCNAAPFGNNEVVLVVRDITRLRNLEEMRKEFVGNISHELRTPLTVISGYIENLGPMSDQLPPAFQRALQQMEQQTERMSNLANDLVMLSKLESVEEKAALKPIALKPLLEQIATDAEALCNGKHSIGLSPADNLSLLGDATQLQSAISNLVFNAVKHNPQGCSVDIAIDSSDRGLKVMVSDDGIGIDPAHLPRLTERFYRVDSSRASSSGGTGLGLAIVKHVLLRHDASLEIDSVLGKGSRFECSFPASRVEKA